MNIEDIKVGETYNVRMKCVDDKERGLRSFVMETMPYIFRLFDKKDIETCVSPLLPPENGIKNTDPAPKYDPNRLFREGDEVRVIEKDGRTVHDPLNGGIWRVARNERTGGAHEMSVLVHLIYEGEKTTHQISVPFCFLELVTPVEELEPYTVGKSELITDDCECDTWAVFDKAGYVVAQYVEEAYKPGEAKARAEQERDRRNAEHRKEQE